MQIYSGAIHIHSKFSDGTGTPEEIAAFANEVGLDYLILTDHNTLAAKTLGFEKYYDKLLFIVGYEINDIQNKNHYLVFGLDRLVGTFRDIGGNEFGCESTAKEYIKLIRENGGTGFIAHPFEKRNHFPQHPPFPWTEWNSDFFDGIEIWNHMSEWVEDLTDKNKIQRFLHPLKSVTSPEKNAVKKWDEINMRRKCPAIGSVDAHAHKQNFLGFYTVEIFPYKVLFKSIRTNVLIDDSVTPGNKADFEKAKKLVVKSLKEGRSYIVNNYYGDAKGFRFFGDYKGEKYDLGDEIILDSNKKATLNCFVPKPADVKLIMNGKCIDTASDNGGVWDVDEPGSYRVECWIGDKAWIFSNHIRISRQ